MNANITGLMNASVTGLYIYLMNASGTDIL